MSEKINNGLLHSFDTSIAEKYGVFAAIIIHNLAFWLKKNLANNRHIHNGYVWTYNSTRAFSELFPYFSSSQIRRVLDKLEANNIIQSEVLDPNKWNRSKWYTIIDSCICRKYQLHLTKSSNGFDENSECSFDEIVQSYTDSKQTDSKPDNKELANLEKFKIFHKAYLGTKRGLQTEYNNFKKKYKKELDSLLDILHTSLSKQIKDRQTLEAKQLFTPQWCNLSTYINQRRWEDQLITKAPVTEKQVTNYFTANSSLDES